MKIKMNKIIDKSIRFLTLIILCIFSLPINAEDNEVFTAKTVEGIEVTYTIISEAQKTCKVGYTYEKKKGVRTAIDKSTSGSITIPSLANGYSVKSVADYAFSSCINLTSIIIPDGVTSLGQSAFNLCSNAVTISIPNSVSGNSFGDFSFAGCESLKEINIPEGVTSIGSAAFRNCKSLLSVNLPSSVKIVYEYAFYGCSSLSSISLSDNLKYIGTSAFGMCCMTSLKLPKSFTTSSGVNNISYSGTDIGTISSLNKVIISKGVSSLYEVFQYCSNIETVICYNEEPVNAYNCWPTANYGTLYVPKGSKEKYESDDNWNSFSRIIEMEANVNYDDVGSTFENNGITYKITNPNPREVQVGLRSGAIDKSTSGDIIIPSTVKNPINQTDYAVKSIGIYAFYNCKNLTSIEVPNSVISIGESAFYGCSGITSMTIPNSVTSIGQHAFYWCSGLSNIDIPNSITSIDNNVFAYCKSLTSVKIPNSVTSLGNYVFQGCAGLTSIIIPNSVTSVGNGLFCDCSSLYSVQIPETITSIGNSFFSGCSKLTSFNISNSIKSIGDYAFSDCTSLNNITIGNSVSSIGENAFKGCNNISTITLNCSEIDAWFKGITSIKEIVFGNNVKSIGSNAFNECKGLAKVSISNSITSIGSSAFYGCNSLTSVEISGLETWCSIKFSNCYSNPLTLAHHLYQNGEEIINLTIPNTVTSIGDYAFYGCNPLTSVKISNSVTNVGNDAFANCSGITTVEIPNSVLTIGDGSFLNCKSLYSVIIPNSVTSIGSSSFSSCYALTSISLSNSITSIGENAFYNCYNLSSLIIPSSVESIGGNAFSQCALLTSVTVESPKPIKISNSVFTSRKNATLYVPTGSKEAYKDANCWKDFKEIVEYGDDGKKYYSLTISAIGDGYVSFSDNTIIGTVQSYSVMEGTSLLMTFSPNVGNHVDSLMVNGVDVTSELLDNTYTLSNIYKNTDIKVIFSSKISFSDPIIKRICVQNWDNNGDGELSENEASLVTSLGNAFRYNSNIKTFLELKYFTGLSSIDSEAFMSCRNLTSVTIPNSVITIGNKSFSGCNALENLGFSNSLTSIGSGAFSDCYGLKDVQIPNSVVFIGDNAFNNCTGLTDISISESVTDIGSYAFSGCSALKTINIPYSVKDIGRAAFERCTSLTAIMIPNSITNIEVELFRGCSGLTSVTIEDGIKSIGSSAFYLCDNLKSLSIPNSITDVSNSAFSGCESLSSIVVDSGNAKYDSRDNCNAIIETSTNKLIIGCKNTIIPNSIKNIGVNAFNQCIGLKSLSIPNSVECIDRYAFMGCINLVKITIPNSVKNIEERAFESCSSLGSIVIPANITTLGFCVFQNCTSLARVESKIKQPFEIDRVFLNLPYNSELYVPYGTKALYESTKGWNVFGEIIETEPLQFDLNIATIGNGSVMCNGKTIRNQSSSINVTEGSSAIISLFPDTGYRIASVKVNEQDVLAQVEDNKLTVSVTDNTNVEIVFEAIPATTYTLAIKANGYGSVVYNNKNVRNSSSEFTLEEGKSATIMFVPDDEYEISSIKINDKEVVFDVIDNKYTITNIYTDITVEVIFEKTKDNLINNGVVYSIVSEEEQTVELTNGNYGLFIEVPATFAAKNKEWKVIGIKTNALRNSTNLAAIIWNPEISFTEEVSNPNLLLYVKSEGYAPVGIKNVIVGNVAKSITLTDAVEGNNFYCPQEFTAEQITYEHNYSMKTGYNSCQGWESIVLPFDVAMVTNSMGTELVPYNLWTHGDSKRPFWLCSMNEDGWKDESTIKANIPYIISMPNNENYDYTYNITGNIVFSASNVTVHTSDNLVSSKRGHRNFVPNYQNTDRSSDIYALNVNNLWSTNTDSNLAEGSAFIRDSRQVRPFEAYMTIDSGGGTTRSINIFDDNETTGIMNLPLACKNKDGLIRVYSLSGMLLKQGNDEKILNDLPKGVYVVNGKKIVK